ncbi:PREDICTED: glutathione S-transferase T3-like [Brassica oleracea var. oleracea]|uniref:glutathione S-transferase T3-like n=1 Tax=Brassica oleracea var. oleracea TaxID=109376 RepID=UPI0006A72C34|nr:PREDICTED: glutathione S-transferase T3-like [Brassica oleracea var. oleracea]
MDSTNPYSHQTTSFVDLLSSQQEPFRYEGFSQLPVFSSQCTATSSFVEDTPTERKERKKWTPTEDIVLISSWLNMSKDPVVGNEQKAGAFWIQIAAYYAASPKVVNGEKREAIQCKQRWQKITDLVSKFCGSYEAATRHKTSGQNDGDVVKLAHEIFYNDHKIKFNLHHAWEELCNDQKWCELTTTKLDGSGKKRRCEDGSQSSSSQATINLDDPPTKRPLGVKAAKGASSKRTIVDGKALSEFQTMWSIKEKDLGGKETLSKMGLLDRLIAKTEPLSEEEEALKKKLIREMLAN